MIRRSDSPHDESYARGPAAVNTHVRLEDNLPASEHAEVAVVGAGVVGSATALALARRGVSVVVARGGDRARPGRERDQLGHPPHRVRLRPGRARDGADPALGRAERSRARRPPRAGAALRGARCVRATRARDVGGSAGRERASATASRSLFRKDGALKVPGEAVTDPVAYTLALAAAAGRHGAELRTGFRVTAMRREDGALVLESAAGESVRSRLVVNCAGLHADTVARLAGDDSFEIYPRKGEFLVFDPPRGESSSGSCSRSRRSARRECWSSPRWTAR